MGKTESYTYDGNDNLLTRLTPKNETISFAYDAVNQLLGKTLPGSQVTSYAYDLVGNLTSITDPDSLLTMTYDLANRLLTTSTAGSSHQPSVTLTYTYDKNGNRLTLADGTATHTYTYDPLNRLASLASPAGSTTFAYDALSRRTSLTLPNGTSTTYTYDPASQVQQILHKLGATGPTINQAAYTYNGVGNRESLTDRRGVQDFGYDNLDRLTSASHPLLATPQAFTYDPVGNRTTVGNVTNAGNQLTADATHAYQYDDNGNLTRKTLLATGNYSQYTYDAENRLTKVEEFVAGNPTAAFTSTYRYDRLGRRIEKVANGQTKRYIYDGEDILLEYDGANVLQARYTHGPTADEPIAVTKGGNTFFYHADGLGTVTELTDSAGTVAKAYAYDSYGNVLETAGSLDQPYGYTGREFDQESTLYYYRARFYDPSNGRFLQKDPIGLYGGINLYRYVANSPVNFIDPLGLEAQLTIGTSLFLGGNPFFFPGIFGGGGMNVGITSSGQVIVQFQATASTGLGVYAGVGIQGGISRSDCDTPTGFSTATSFQADANVGFGPSVGGTVQYAGGGNAGINTGVGRLGAGYGVHVSAGVTTTTTYAVPIPFLYPYLQSNAGKSPCGCK